MWDDHSSKCEHSDILVYRDNWWFKSRRKWVRSAIILIATYLTERLLITTVSTGRIVLHWTGKAIPLQYCERKMTSGIIMVYMLLNMKHETYQNVWSSRSRTNGKTWTMISFEKTFKDTLITKIPFHPQQVLWTIGIYVHTSCINCYVLVDDMSSNLWTVHRRHDGWMMPLLDDAEI